MLDMMSRKSRKLCKTTRQPIVSHLGCRDFGFNAELRFLFPAMAHHLPPTTERLGASVQADHYEQPGSFADTVATANESRFLLHHAGSDSTYQPASYSQAPDAVNDAGEYLRSAYDTVNRNSLSDKIGPPHHMSPSNTHPAEKAHLPRFDPSPRYDRVHAGQGSSTTLQMAGYDINTANINPIEDQTTGRLAVKAKSDLFW
jgi:hypothetical protein